MTTWGPSVRKIILLEERAQRLERQHIAPLRARLKPWLAKRDALWKEIGILERLLSANQLTQLRRARMTRAPAPGGPAD